MLAFGLFSYMVADLKRTPLSLHFGCNEEPHDAAARKCLCQKKKREFPVKK
ncbi:hypothetical protein Hanom_Chr03g00278381 [Helianthus anomalus]